MRHGRRVGTRRPGPVSNTAVPQPMPGGTTVFSHSDLAMISFMISLVPA